MIDNKEVLDKLASLAKEEFTKMEVTENTYKSLVHSINASKNGDYVFHYNCPTLIVTANKKDYGNNIADCACALENMMLMANALDLGSVWINQLRWLGYYKALQMGEASKVVPIDKLSVVITLILAFIFLHEQFTLKSLIGCVLIGVGTLIMVL